MRKASVRISASDIAAIERCEDFVECIAKANDEVPCAARAQIVQHPAIVTGADGVVEERGRVALTKVAEALGFDRR